MAGASARSGVWVFHRGALGDGLLLWPMLRALAARHPVVLATDGERGALASLELGIAAVNAEAPEVASMWVAGARLSPHREVAAVHAYLGRGAAARGVWLANAARAFPGAVVALHPGRPDATLARLWAARGPRVPVGRNPAGQIVVHVGAGRPDKRWPMASWRCIAELLGKRLGGPPATVLAGEAEDDAGKEAASFRDLGGHFVRDLADLATCLRGARLFLGADTGPTHLAAQLGVPTLALFGPTRPDRWAPVGPAVRVLAPPAPRPMTWLSPDVAGREALDFLALVEDCGHQTLRSQVG
jgi:ADP-heptose:LPS heptosyltransferase